MFSCGDVSLCDASKAALAVHGSFVGCACGRHVCFYFLFFFGPGAPGGEPQQQRGRCLLHRPGLDAAQAQRRPQAQVRRLHRRRPKWSLSLSNIKQQACRCTRAVNGRAAPGECASCCALAGMGVRTGHKPGLSILATVHRTYVERLRSASNPVAISRGELRPSRGGWAGAPATVGGADARRA